MTSARIAVVHDWLDTWGGGENVLAEILRIYPQADLYALVDFMPDALRARLGSRRASTTFIQRLPGARRYFRQLLPLFPRAIESLDLRRYDLIVSSSHAVAKGVRTSAAQLHVCYCHTPMRYAWDLRAEYLAAHGLDRGIRGAIANRLLDRLREWDRRSSRRVTAFVANSNFVRERIARSYGRDAAVINPPVDTDFFTPGAAPESIAARGYYFTASRWVPYKRIDLIVAAFRNLPGRRLIVAGDGPEGARIRAAAGPSVQFAGAVTRERMRELLRGARAFVFAAEEDFGILPVEAQACGTPVVAFGRGGVTETVVPPGRGPATGLFFDAQTPAAIAAAIEHFDPVAASFDPSTCRARALQFSSALFARRFTSLVEDLRRRTSGDGG